MVMMDAVLTAGTSSRFALNLVKGRESVIQYEANIGWPFAGPADYKEPGVYATFVLHKPDVPAREIVEQIVAEIGKIKNEGVPEAELSRVKAYLRSYRIRELQSTMARARYLGQYEIFDRDPGFINTELDRIMKVTGAQIRDVARSFIVPNRRSVLEIAPAPQKKESQ
jgi:predicted Zn-dependent peptidase